MNINRKFVAGIVAFLVMMFVLQQIIPKGFLWAPTFRHDDPNPFGCYVFDSVMSQSLPNGYGVGRETLGMINRGRKNVNVLVVADDVYATMSVRDINAADSIARRGGRVMIVGGQKKYDRDVDSVMLARWGASFTCRHFNISTLRKAVRGGTDNLYDTIYWNKDAAVYGDRMYPEYAMLVAYLQVDAGSAAGNRILANMSGNDSRPVAVVCKKGGGEVILVSTPLLFTNYGILDDVAPQYIFRLMSHIADRPVLRTTAYSATASTVGDKASPLRIVLAKPPLRTALYLTMALLVLFMAFTARRRQRVIPVIQSPRNRSLEFVQFIGTLYFRSKAHADIVRKKYFLFAGELQRLLLLDITDTKADSRNLAVISMRTGMRIEELRGIIRGVRDVVDRKTGVTEHGMRKHIDDMNRIISNIT